VDWSSRIGAGMVSRPNGRPPSNDDPPWSLIVAVLVLCLVLIVIVPVMGLMYLEMNEASKASIRETNRMRELRLQILKERQNAN
jgi:hypothetical protein